MDFVSLAEGAVTFSSDANGHTIVARRDIVEVLGGVDAGERGRVVGEDGSYVVVELKDGTYLRCSGHNVEIVKMSAFALRVGDKVQTDDGPGKVIRVAEGGGGSVPGMPYRQAGDVMVQLNDGRTGWLSERDVRKMDSVHVTEREETTMAQSDILRKKLADAQDKWERAGRAEEKAAGDREKAEAEYRRTGSDKAYRAAEKAAQDRDKAERDIRDARIAVDEIKRELSDASKHSQMDVTEVVVGADGSVDVCVDPEGDEARAGLMATFAGTSAACPYCSKSTAINSFGQLGHHRAPGGACDGAGKQVARVEMGRAVLMASASDFPASVKYKGRTYYSTGKVGTRRKDGKAVAEYSSRDENDREIGRVWSDATGRDVYED